MKMLERSLVAATVLIGATMIGCGSDLPETFRSTGSVTLEGKPLPSVIVTFIPKKNGSGASGTADQQGKFTLSTFSPSDGVLAGDYSVTIIPKDPPPMGGDSDPGIGTGGGSPKPGRYTPRFPSRYGMPEESGLKATVEAKGKNVFIFDLNRK